MLQHLFSDSGRGAVDLSIFDVGRTARAAVRKYYARVHDRFVDHTIVGASSLPPATLSPPRCLRDEGALCYSVSIGPVGPCEGNTFTWRDPAGTPIATGNIGGATPNSGVATVTCSNGGEQSACRQSVTGGCSWNWLFPPKVAPSGCSSGPCGSDAGTTDSG